MIIDYYGVVTELHDALELYSALEENFDKEDLEGTLTNVTEELRKLPDQHAAVWAFFADLENKRDEEAFELTLADPDVRDQFYTALSTFLRSLKLGLSSVRWVRETDEAQIDRYKKDALFFQRLRASVKIRYAEEVDYRDYEAQIEKMLNTYVQANEIVQVVDPVNIFEREAFQEEVDKARSPRAKADIIANRTKKTIPEKMEEDPFFYRKFSDLIQQAIEDYKAQRISEAEYLAKMIEYMEAVRKGKSDYTPDLLRERDLAMALFGSMKEQLGSPLSGKGQDDSDVLKEDTVPYQTGPERKSSPDELLAEAACHVEDIIRKHNIVGWRENVDAQNRMRNDMDDYLFELQDKHGVQLSLAQMDDFIETVLRIARNRTQDV